MGLERPHVTLTECLESGEGNPLWHGSQALTARECEVLCLHAKGKTAKEIARILGISATTVKFHTRNAAGKLGAKNKTAAVACALRLGWLR